MRSRKRRIGLAYVAAGGAKITGGLVQLATLPIAAHALGAESLGLLFTVAAMMSFPLIAMAGFSPAASVLMSKAQACDDKDKIGGYFWSLLFWSIVAGAVLAIMSYIALTAFRLPGYDDPALAPALVIFLLLNYLTSQIDGARAALQQSHLSSGFAVVGSVFTLALALVAGAAGGSTATFFYILYVVPMVAQLLNLITFLYHHRYLLGAPRLEAAVVPEILDILSANIQAQGGMVLYLHGSVYLLAHYFGTAAVAVIGAFVRVAVLVHSMLVAFYNPVLPTISEATAKHDFEWIKRALRNLFVVAGIILIGQAILTAVAGRWLADHILNETSAKGPLFFLCLATFIFCYSMTYLLFLTKLAIAFRNKRGLKILLAAIAGQIFGHMFALDSMALYLAIQAAAMALIAMLVYAYELLGIAREPIAQ